MSQRKKIIYLGILFLGLVVITHAINNPGTNFDLRSLAQVNSEYGFNTHVSCCGSNLNLDIFKQNVNDLALNKQKWIRFNIIAEEIAPSGSAYTINWDLDNLATYDQAIDYSLGKGLKIFLVTSVPVYAKDYSLSDYQSVTGSYLDFLIKRYQGKISVWQVFNEADVHNYRDYSPLPSLTSQYLSELSQIIHTARNTIKQTDSRVLVTTNAGGYPLSKQVQNRWFKYFDTLNKDLDIISLDLYPDVNNVENEMKIMGRRVLNVADRYNKKVSVAETGMCTRSEYFSEGDQKLYLPQYIQYLKKARPKVILLYEIQDENNISGCEGSFGIKRYNGSHKPAYDKVMNLMSN